MTTTFTYPVRTKRANEGLTAATSFDGRFTPAVQATINTTKTGTAAGTTTIPLFIAPAGSTVLNAFMDIRTAYDATADVNVQIGTSALPATIFAATTVNTAGRRTYSGSAAQVSANAVAFTADTTIQAIVSITTSAVTVGDILVTVILL